MSVNFRQINIDRYDPNSPVNTLPETEPAAEAFPVDVLKQAVQGLLSSGKNLEALATVLESPPYNQPVETKAAVADIVLSVLCAFRATEIEEAIQALDKRQRTVLTKYLYKLGSLPQGQSNGSVVLNWMGKTFAIGGEGIIIRHITDRRLV